MAAVLMTFIIGLSFLFSKIALNYTSSFTILTHRFLLASIVILPFALLKKNNLKLNKDEFKLVIKMALLYPVLIFTAQILGLNFVSSAGAGIIQATQPLIITFLAAILLNEKTTKIQNIFLLVSAFGAIFIFVNKLNFQNMSEFFGQILILFSCIFLSFYAVLSRKNRNSINSFKLTFYCILFGTVFFTVFWILQSFFYGDTKFFEPFKNLEYNLALFYLAIPSSLLTLVLTNYSYARVEAYKIGILNNLIPIIAVVAGVLILNEMVSISQIFGMILIFVGIIGVNLRVIK